MSKIFFVGAWVLFMVLQPKLQAVELIDRPVEGKQYERLTFRFSQNLHYENPFDLVTNRVEVHIVQPDSSKLILSFFYDGTDKEGVEQWEARFAPSQAGSYHFSVELDGKVQNQFEIPVKPASGTKLGGLKLSPQRGKFEYQSGEAFRGIGLNVCWAQDYEYYFKKMRSAGINVTRIWMCPWSLSFEWRETGIGRYNLRSAKRFDSILALAEQCGIYVILCIDYHGIAPKGVGYFKEDRWLENPYNKINGGPCTSEAELFTSADAKSYFQKKYKYIISRFGSCSNIAAWEFINEADLMAGTSRDVNRWHEEMGEYIRSIDVHHRLISASSTRSYMEKLVDAFRSPALDFVMYHDYNSLDIAPHFIDFFDAANDYYHKPVVLAEFGIEFRSAERTMKNDPENIGLHNGIWSGLFSETPIIPLSWWWDSYVDRKNLWSEYASLSRFADSLDFNSDHLDFKTLKAGYSTASPQKQIACMVRCIVAGDGCAVWFKNPDYAWSLVYEGKKPRELEAFTQTVPDLAPGRYSIAWYNPQSGEFTGKPLEDAVKDDGILSLTVPSFSKDLACIIQRLP